MVKRKKDLTEADVDVWARVTRTVKAYNGSKTPTVHSNSSAPAFAPRRNVKIMAKNIRPRNVGVIAHHQTHPPQIAKDKRVRRGKINVDRKIDLHDLTQDAALARLTQTLYSASVQNQRCVLVITGKGGVHMGGVLRRMLPIWLSSADLRPLISRYAPAHLRHGGSGAWYVFLKAQDLPRHPLA